MGLAKRVVTGRNEQSCTYIGTISSEESGWILSEELEIEFGGWLANDDPVTVYSTLNRFCLI